MRILKANTAVRLVVGPLCDKTTGLAKAGMTVTNMAMNMWHEHDDGSAPTKSIDAVSFTASGGNNDMVELAGGYYDIEITAAQLNITAGRCGFLIYDDDVILPYFEEWLIVPANVFDSIMGTDYLDVNAAQLGGTNQTGNDVGADVNDIKAKTDNLPSDPADESLLEAAITSAVATIRGVDSDTLKTLSDQIDGISTGGGSSAAEIWSYSVRTLTQSAASVVATVSGSDITCTRGDSFSASLTDVGALTGYSKVYFTVKKDKDDADAVSIIQIEKTAGLKYIDGGTATTAANGTLTITDEATGDITIALDEAETAKLDGGVYYYDVQIVRSAGTVSTLTSGNFTVSADVTRAVT